MTSDQKDEIMAAYTKNLRASFVRGVSIGTKIGAEYVSQELGTPEEWVAMDREQLIEKLIAGKAKAEEIKNSNKKKTATEEDML